MDTTGLYGPVWALKSARPVGVIMGTSMSSLARGQLTVHQKEIGTLEPAQGLFIVIFRSCSWYMDLVSFVLKYFSFYIQPNLFICPARSILA